MRAFRLTRKDRVDLSGEGARRYGGRSNSIDVPMVYAAPSRGTALAEVAVHFVSDVVPDYVLLELELPDEQALYYRINSLSQAADPATAYQATQTIGNTFVEEGRFLGLWVPSVVVHGDWNLLLNPLHPAMAEVRIVGTSPFPIDPRLLRRS